MFKRIFATAVLVLGLIVPSAVQFSAVYAADNGLQTGDYNVTVLYAKTNQDSLAAIGTDGNDLPDVPNQSNAANFVADPAVNDVLSTQVRVHIDGDSDESTWYFTTKSTDAINDIDLSGFADGSQEPVETAAGFEVKMDKDSTLGTLRDFTWPNYIGLKSAGTYTMMGVTDMQPVQTTQPQTLADGEYNVPIAHYKTGTTDPSTMDKYFGSSAKVAVAGDQATVTLSVTDSGLDYLTAYRLDTQSTTTDKTALKDLLYSDSAAADHANWVPQTANVTVDKTAKTFTTTVPLADLSDTIHTAMEINAGSYGMMYQSADMVFALDQAQKIDASSSSTSSSAQQASSSSAASSTPSSSVSSASSAQSSAASSSSVSQSSSSAVSSSNSSAVSSSTASQTVLPDGTYQLNVFWDEAGGTASNPKPTGNPSMIQGNGFWSNEVTLTVKNGAAKLTFTEPKGMDWMKYIKLVGDQFGTADLPFTPTVLTTGDDSSGTGKWSVNLTAKQALKLTNNANILLNLGYYVPQINFDHENVLVYMDIKSGAPKPVTVNVPTQSSSSSSAASSSQTTKPVTSKSNANSVQTSDWDIATAKMNKLPKFTGALTYQILNTAGQLDTHVSSFYAQRGESTTKVAKYVKNANGTYDVYVLVYQPMIGQLYAITLPKSDLNTHQETVVQSVRLADGSELKAYKFTVKQLPATGKTLDVTEGIKVAFHNMPNAGYPIVLRLLGQNAVGATAINGDQSAPIVAVNGDTSLANAPEVTSAPLVQASMTVQNSAPSQQKAVESTKKTTTTPQTSASKTSNQEGSKPADDTTKQAIIVASVAAIVGIGGGLIFWRKWFV
ncbi:MAG TPA: NEAT domain-containing protein [Lactobacillaceae bacterium]|jgi:hypothetical protein